MSFGGSRSREPARGGSGGWGWSPGGDTSLLSREMPLEDGDTGRQRGRQVNGEVGSVPRLRGMGDPPDGSSRTDTVADGWEQGPAPGDGDGTPGGAPEQAWKPEEALMTELSELVQKVVKSSSWWERHGVDISILACSFLLLPAGNLAQPLQTWPGRSPGLPLPPHHCFVLGASWHLLRF